MMVWDGTNISGDGGRIKARMEWVGGIKYTREGTNNGRTLNERDGWGGGVMEEAMVVGERGERYDKEILPLRVERTNRVVNRK